VLLFVLMYYAFSPSLYAGSWAWTKKTTRRLRCWQKRMASCGVGVCQMTVRWYACASCLHNTNSKNEVLWWSPLERRGADGNGVTMPQTWLWLRWEIWAETKADLEIMNFFSLKLCFKKMPLTSWPSIFPLCGALNTTYIDVSMKSSPNFMSSRLG